MSDPKERQRESEIEFLARQLFVSSAARPVGILDPAAAFSLAEAFMNVSHARWEKVSK